MGDCRILWKESCLSVGRGIACFRRFTVWICQDGPQLYAFRGISGVGNGGITALAIVIVPDVVTLENRGKYSRYVGRIWTDFNYRYQGILGPCVSLGNTIGPFLAAAFVEKSTWRGLFWCICPCWLALWLHLLSHQIKSTAISRPKSKRWTIRSYLQLLSNPTSSHPPFGRRHLFRLEQPNGDLHDHVRWHLYGHIYPSRM